MSRSNTDVFQELTKEIKELKEEILALRKILLPEIAMSKEELAATHKILHQMEKGDEYPLNSVQNDK